MKPLQDIKVNLFQDGSRKQWILHSMDPWMYSAKIQWIDLEKDLELIYRVRSSWHKKGDRWLDIYQSMSEILDELNFLDRKYSIIKSFEMIRDSPW
jgi:hypothetical protein